jgi:hypothetical protein
MKLLIFGEAGGCFRITGFFFFFFGMARFYQDAGRVVKGLER